MPTGHLVYAFEDELFAIRFDVASLEVGGGAVPLMDGLLRASSGFTGSANFSFSDQGTFIHSLDTGDAADGFVLAVVDREGVAERLNVPPAFYNSPRVSPDGTQVVVVSDDGELANIWVYALSGPTAIRQLTFDGRNMGPIWTPDGEWITFVSNRDAEQPGTASIYRTPADGSGVAERLTTAEGGHVHVPESYAGDGRLSFRKQAVGQTDVWTLSSEDGAEPEVFVDLPESNQLGSVFSPDGAWVAYHSDDESGDRVEIYVQPFPPTGAKSQITQTGGAWPIWSPDGSQLFFRRGNRLNAVDIETTPAVTFGGPQPIPVRLVVGGRPLDIMPDGERFVVVSMAEVINAGEQSAPDQINIILNWFEELKERVPVP